ncbi:PRMT10, partial [Symbiodinium pilosum]
DPGSIPSVERFDDADFHELVRCRADDNTECAICLANMLPHEDAMQLPCAARHVFHEECVRSWLSRNVTCPLCRVDVRALVRRQSRSQASAPPTHGDESQNSPRAFGYTRDGGVILRYDPRKCFVGSESVMCVGRRQSYHGAALKDGKPPDETDNANYFCEYAYLYHQMDMLEDAHRTGSYFDAVMRNRENFKDKVVLDVGAGTCILSIFAAKAGAKQVFAVEATDMAVRSRKIVEAQGLSHIIKVVQGTVETVTLPCMVDVIISEWMGYFLLRESMLDSVLVARDRFLKPGGALFPSHATLFLAPVGPFKTCREKQQTFDGEQQHFEDFNGSMMQWYGTDFSCMRDEFLAEQRMYYLQTGMFVNLSPKQLAGTASPVLEIDLLKITIQELQAARPLTCTMRVTKDGQLDGFTGYFDVAFRGSPESPVKQEVILTTAPTTSTHTHWGQQLFGFFPALQVRRGDALEPW